MGADRGDLLLLAERVSVLEERLRKLLAALYLDEPQLGSASLNQELKELHYEAEGW